MSTSIKSNLYALLPDDAEDATEAVVRRAPQQEKAKSSSSTSSRVTNKVKIPQIVDSVQVEEEEDTTLAEQEVVSATAVVGLRLKALARIKKNTHRTKWRSIMCK